MTSTASSTASAFLLEGSFLGTGFLEATFLEVPFLDDMLFPSLNFSITYAIVTIN